MRERLGRQIHVSWLIAWFSFAIISGIGISYWVHNPVFASPEMIFACLVLFVVAIVKCTVRATILVIVAGLLLGLCRGSTEQLALKKYQSLYGQKVTIIGTLNDDTSAGNSGNLQMQLKNISVNGIMMHGEIWVSSESNVQPKRSDIVKLYGKLKPGFGSFAASMTFADVESITRSSNQDFGLLVRNWFASDIRKIIPEPQASLSIGYLLGQKTALPQNLDTDFKIVGLTHAVVASGYNLTILVAFAIRRLSKTSKYLTAMAAGLMAGGFMLVAGFSPSMTRAGLVTGLSLAAWYYGRAIHPMVILPLAAAITVLLKPEYAWGDIGWALSFAAFAGVLIIAPLLHRTYWNKKQPGAFREIFIGTMSAQIATMPIMIFAFGQYSPYALIANVLVLPLVPIIMILTFLIGLAGIILPVTIAHFIAWPNLLLLRYSTATVEYIAGLPGAAATMDVTTPLFMAAYVIILVFMYLLWRKTHYSFRPENAVEQSVF